MMMIAGANNIINTTPKALDVHNNVRINKVQCCAALYPSSLNYSADDEEDCLDNNHDNDVNDDIDQVGGIRFVPKRLVFDNIPAKKKRHNKKTKEAMMIPTSLSSTRRRPLLRFTQDDTTGVSLLSLQPNMSRQSSVTLCFTDSESSMSLGSGNTSSSEGTVDNRPSQHHIEKLGHQATCMFPCFSAEGDAPEEQLCALAKHVFHQEYECGGDSDGDGSFASSENNNNMVLSDACYLNMSQALNAVRSMQDYKEHVHLNSQSSTSLDTIADELVLTIYNDNVALLNLDAFVVIVQQAWTENSTQQTDDPHHVDAPLNFGNSSTWSLIHELETMMSTVDAKWKIVVSTLAVYKIAIAPVTLSIPGAVFFALLSVHLYTIWNEHTQPSLRYKRRMKNLDGFLRREQLPQEHIARIKNVFQNNHPDGNYYDEEEVTKDLDAHHMQSIQCHRFNLYAQQCPLFGAQNETTRAFVQQLSAVVERTVYLANEVIFPATSHGDFIYFVASGMVDLCRSSEKRSCFHIVTSGGCFGFETSYLAGHQSFLAARARVACILYRVRATDWWDLMTRRFRPIHATCKVMAIQRLVSMYPCEQAYENEGSAATSFMSSSGEED